MSVPGNYCNPCQGARTIVQGCVMKLSGECVYYSGSALSGPGINPGDNLNTVVNKLITYAGGAITTGSGLTNNLGVVKWGGTLQGFTQLNGGTVAEQILFNGQSNANLGTYQDAFVMVQAADAGIGGPVGIGVYTPPGTGGTAIQIDDSDVGIVINNSSQAAMRINGANSGIEVISNAQPAITARSNNNNSVDARTGGPGRAVYCESTAQTNGIPFQANIATTTIALIPTVAVFSQTNNFQAPQNSGIAIEFRPKTNLGDLNAYQTRIASKMTDVSGTLGQTEIWGIMGYSGGPTYSNSFKIWHQNGGKVAIGNTIPTPQARLHLPAGVNVLNMVPLKFTSGPLVTTPENGSMEYDGTNLYFTVGTTRNVVLLNSTPGGTLYTGNGTLSGNRTITCGGFGVTWTNVGLFRLTNGTAASGGTYDFQTTLNFTSYNSANSSNIISDPVTGVGLQYVDVPGVTTLSALNLDAKGIKLTGVPEFADNAAAITGGLTAGYIYKTTNGTTDAVLKIVF
jgi:hypothetical protein